MQVQLDNKGKRMAIIICGSVALLGLWIAALFVTYEDHQRSLLEQSIVHPGAVSYGTHSVVKAPMVSVTPRRSGLPIISGAAVRHYAYSGHADMPASQTNHPVVHTLSSATVKTIGGGGNGSGAGMSSGSSSSSFSRGIIYGHASVSMPSLAWVSTSANRTASPASDEALASAPDRRSHVRKTVPGAGDGDEGDWFDGGSDGWWYHDEDGWRTPYTNETRYDETLGYVVVWNGTAWEKVTKYDPKVPVGDVPWLYMLFLCGIICVIRKNIVPSNHAYASTD